MLVRRRRLLVADVRRAGPHEQVADQEARQDDAYDW